MSKHDEHILATVTNPNIESINGFVPLDDLNLLPFTHKDLIFGHRERLETNTALKQIIPYVLVKSKEKYLVYSRNKKGGESRLHDKLSIGFGGHINLEDNDLSNGKVIDLDHCVDRCIERELEEELGWNLWMADNYPKLIGILNLKESIVDEVHLGLVYTVEYDHSIDRLVEDCINLVDFMPLEELIKNQDSMENWSKEVIKHLTKLV